MAKAAVPFAGESARRLEALTPQACRVCTTGLPRRHGGMDAIIPLLYITQTRGNQSQRRRPEHRPPLRATALLRTTPHVRRSPFLRTSQTERRPGTEKKRRRKHAPSEQPDAAGEAQSGGSDGQKSTGHGRRDCGSSLHCRSIHAGKAKFFIKGCGVAPRHGARFSCTYCIFA